MANSITPTQGNLGIVSNRTTLLPYSVTTDGTMGTITEKVNGVTVGTRNAPVSGQDYTVSLTQAQWDAVRFGKYSGKNMLPPFRHWTIDDEATITGDYSLELNASASTQYTSYIVDVEPNADYTLSVTQTGADARVQVRSVDRSQVLANIIGEGLQTATFNTGSLTQVQIEMSNVAAGTFTFDNPQLEKGTSATPFHAIGENNTLTIEMGDNTWTYTFDKRPANDADILSAVKAVKDSQEVHLPNIKRQLVDKVGGNVADSFEEIIGGAVLGRKMASGSIISNGFRIQVNGLGFTPSVVIAKWKAQENSHIGNSIFVNKSILGTPYDINFYNASTTISSGDSFVTSSGFDLRAPSGDKEYAWTAYE